MIDDTMSEVEEKDWIDRPVESDCLHCRPRPGTGRVFGYTCTRCLGTGLEILPLAEIGVDWDKDAVDIWLSSEMDKIGRGREKV
jgi:hypothetical protein